MIQQQLTILITGGAGYIGSHVAYAFFQLGYRVVILDSFIHNQLCNLSWATVIKSDYADEEALSTIFTTYTIHVVVHCAAFIEVGESVINPLAFYENNVTKTVALLQSMIKHDIKKIIFSSSCAVYGNPEFLPLTEDHPKNPISPYGKTKLMVEMMLEDFQKAYGLGYICLRYFNAAGALPEEGLGEQHEPETHLIPRILRAALYKTSFTLFGTDYETKDGTAIRDFVHVRDIARAHVLALQYLNANGLPDCFNLGTGYGFSIQEIIKMVEKICDTKIKVLYKQRRAGDPAILVANGMRAQSVLGWEPFYSQLERIIMSAYDFELYCNISYKKNKTIEESY